MKNITGLEIPSNYEALFKSLESYEAQGEVPTRRNNREEGLIEEVALDLALSMDVFSAVPLITRAPRGEDAPNDDELDRATQALSIADDGPGRLPPPVVFNFLQPRYVITAAPGQDMDANLDGTGTVGLPVGVRQLLADWELGADPNQFPFRNPYEQHEPTLWRRGRKAMGKKPDRGGLYKDAPEAQIRSQIPVIMASSQLPPTILAQQARHKQHKPPPVIAHEGGFGFGSTQGIAVSQPLEGLNQGGLSGASPQTLLGPSTKVLPGPYGGRPEGIVAKKKQKRRAKGF